VGRDPELESWEYPSGKEIGYEVRRELGREVVGDLRKGKSAKPSEGDYRVRLRLGEDSRDRWENCESLS